MSADEAEPTTRAQRSDALEGESDKRADRDEAAEAPFPELALNLADIGHEANLAASNPAEMRERLAYFCNEACARFQRPRLDRLYVGSYFCDRFFLSLNRPFYDGVTRFCREYDLGLTLVVPIFGQSSLAAGRKRIEALLNRKDERGFLFDEAVANDPATALLLKEIGDARTTPDGKRQPLSLSFGRMMAKTARDPRYAVLAESAQPYALDRATAEDLAARFGYRFAECDPTAPHIDAAALDGAVPLALHLPHCLMTTGHICQPASATRPFAQKFRPDAPCRQECLSGIQVYEHRNYDDDQPIWLTRLGRTVFFENPDCEVAGQAPARIVWTPADFACARTEDTWANPTDPALWQPFEGGASWE